MNPVRSTFIKMPPTQSSFLSLPPDVALAKRLAEASGGSVVPVVSHTFPDGETYLRLAAESIAPDVVIVGALQDPDRHTLPLLLLADAARQWGATRVGLVAPYLPYMRQDAALHPGDAVTARSFARILSRGFDWLVTIDPHLHRVHRLSEIYTIPARVIHAAPALGKWIAEHVESPLIVGPDSESRQWAEDVAATAKAPLIVLEKMRRGDADVAITMPFRNHHEGRVPVLVDDIISTGSTMAATVRALVQRGFPPPVCVAVHALFAPGSYEALQAAGTRVVATTNTIPHVTNQIDVGPLLATALARRRGRRVAKR